MQIQVKDLSRKFIKDWIFKNLNYTFESSKKYAIIGPNGSGKSTLLQIIAGFVPPSYGEIIYSYQEKIIDSDSVFSHIGYAAPYLETIEEFTLKEILEFHFKFKKLQHFDSIKELIDFLYLEKSVNKPVKYFSSGMKQRLKLGLAFFSDTSLLILDEPTSNMDKFGVDWYQHLIDNFTGNRTVIIGSNQEYEYQSCSEILKITDYQVY